MENRRRLSLNDFLDIGLALQNLLRRILIRTEFKQITLYSDLQKAFLQIRIKKEDRNARRFHQVRKEDLNQVQII